MGCGLTGAVWRARHVKPRAWCRDATTRERARAIRARDNQLSKCLAGAGGGVQGQCILFARLTISRGAIAKAVSCPARRVRWQTDYAEQYNRCAARHDRRLKIANRQRVALNACLGSVENVRRPVDDEGISCRTLGRVAQFQADANRRMGCGLSGRRWNVERGDWCNMDFDRADRLLVRRDRDLGECFANAGGSKTDKCVLFGRLAEARSNVSKTMQCGNRGGAWRSDYEHQYQRCSQRFVSRIQLAQQQERALATCLR